MLALDPIPDAVRTAGNVTGDLAVTTAVARRRDTEAKAAGMPERPVRESAT
jgi:Na+/H+-dicarboxylate symporter